MTNFILVVLFMLYLVFIVAAVSTVCFTEIKKRVKMIEKWDKEAETIKRK